MFKKGIILALTGAFIAAALGSIAYPQGAATLVQIITGGVPVSGSNPLPVSGTFSASFAGFPTTQTTGTPIAVTTGGVTGTLPTGTVVVASNVGATNGAYCKLGASATTSDQLIPPNSWFAFTVGASTQLTCITSASTTTVNMVGGSGLPTGSGGGGGGGSAGGAVFGPTAVGSANANPPVVIGGTATGAAGQNVEGVAVKPASTAPLASDLALVAALSPNGNQATVANQTAPNTASTTNPTSTLTLPVTTTAYTAGTLICTNPTVATCNTALGSQSFAIASSGGSAAIYRLRLTTNDSTSTAWGNQTIQIDLWSAAPTFVTTGDRGVFATDFSTGTAGHLGSFTCVMSVELADGAYSECTPAYGNFNLPKLASGTSVFWTAQAVTGSGVTGASKVFTLTAELQN